VPCQALFRHVMGSNPDASYGVEINWTLASFQATDIGDVALENGVIDDFLSLSLKYLRSIG
jgi:hypothetical protein